LKTKTNENDNRMKKFVAIFGTQRKGKLSKKFSKSETWLAADPEENSRNEPVTTTAESSSKLLIISLFHYFIIYLIYYFQNVYDENLSFF